MRILNNIARNIKTHAGTIIKKGVGIAALGLICYDANHIGKVQADTYASEKDFQATHYYLNNTMYSTSMSSVGAKVKDAALNMELDQGWRRVINSAIGYVKGFTSMLINHVIPLGLAIGTLATKGSTSKVFATLTASYGLLAGIKNFFGIGTPHKSIKN